MARRNTSRPIILKEATSTYLCELREPTDKAVRSYVLACFTFSIAAMVWLHIAEVRAKPSETPPHREVVANRVRSVDSKNLKRTAVVATADWPLPEHKNVIWCSTIQMAWDRLKGDVIGEPIRIPGVEETTNRLNQTRFPVADVEPESYYAAAGLVSDGIIEQVQREMRSRFPSESIPTFDEKYKILPLAFLAYSYLNVDIGFEYPYYRYGSAFDFQDSNGVRIGVTAFCAQASLPDANLPRVREQVEILYYEYADNPEQTEFAVDLCKHTRPYQIVLACMPQPSNLDSGTRAVLRKMTEFRNDPNCSALCTLRPIDHLIVPDVLYKLTHHFDELTGRPLGNEKWTQHFIFEAMQQIDFTLSRTGVVLKSEARFGGAGSAPRRIQEPRRLYFNRPFLILVKKRQPDAAPFFIMWVDNAELMKRHP